MNDLNNVFLVGRLTKNMEITYTATGTAIGKMTLASNESVKKGDGWQDTAHFFDCVLWGKLASSLAQYLVKGKQVVVLGKLRQNRWQDQEGRSRSRIEITVLQVQFMGDKHQKQEQPSNKDSFHDDLPY